MNWIERANSRGSLLCAGVAIWIIVVVLFAGHGVLPAGLLLATDGVTAAVWIAGATALGAVCLFRFDNPPLLQIASAGGLGLGIFSLSALGLGLAGWLSRPVAWAFPVVGIVPWLGMLCWHHRRWLASSPALSFSPVRAWLSRPAGIGWLWLIPVVALALACVGGCVLPGLLWKPLDPHPYDVMSYHFQVVREWFELERIVPLHHNVFSYFPFNVEMQFLLAMHATGGPWAGMYVCQFINVGISILMVLAVAGAASKRGHGVIAAAVVCCVPWVVMLSCVGYVEAGLMLYSTLALVWAIVAMESREGYVGRLLIAGVFAGLACGVKFTAVPMLMLGVGVGWLVAFTSLVLRIRLFGVPQRPACGEAQSNKRAIIGFVLFGTAAMLVLSPWLIRNYIWSGNPVFPIAMQLLGRGHFSVLQMHRFEVAHSPRPDQSAPLERLRIFWNLVLIHWQYGFVLLPAAVIAGFRRNRAVVFLWVNAIIVLIVWVGFTHLEPRFAISLVPIAGVALALVDWSRWRAVGVGLAIVALCVGLVPTAAILRRQIAPVADAGLFGIEKLDFPTLNDVERLDPTGSQSVALIGDAGAFLVQVPMSRLRYKTVFDLPGNVSDPVDGWAGKGVRGNPHWLLAIDPSEIARLHRTYLDVPSLPATYPVARGHPSVVEATTIPPGR